MPLSVLVVCLGNICRSPIGEAVLRHVAQERGVEIVVDSAGTAGYHVGEDPDYRAVATCKKFKVPLNHHARQITKSDFTRFTHIVAADANNLRAILRVKPSTSTANISMWGAYLDHEEEISDPYYGGIDGFEECYHQCVRLSNAFLNKVVPKEQ